MVADEEKQQQNSCLVVGVRKKHTLSMEFFPNELFLDIYEYLSSVDLLRAFDNLNLRLNHLLFLHFQTRCLNFQSASKYDFDLICQKYLPCLTDRISSLRLSDDDDTPNQIDLFFAHGLSFRQFSYLQSLSIHRIYSLNTMKLLVKQLIDLPHLTHLSITRYFIQYIEEYDLGIVECIGRLPKLLSCHLDITKNSEYAFAIPLIRSFSLKYLSLPHLDYTIKQFLTLIQHNLNLQSVTAGINDFSQIFLTPVIVFPSMKISKLIFNGSFHAIRNLLSTMPNLEQLTIELISSYIDGYQWENLLETTLPNLLHFHLKMSISFSYEKSPEQQIDEVLNSFSHSFWIEKHRWFVQCHWAFTATFSTACIYTLPYVWPHFLYFGTSQLKSTSLYHTFDHVHTLYYASGNPSFSSIHFYHLRHLDLNMPWDDSLWSIVTRFDRVKSLKIVLMDQMNEIDRIKLQSLFNRLTHLRSVTFFSWSIENNFPIQVENSSIQKLDLRVPNQFYTHQQCEQLIRSSIVQQCRTLLINVQQRMDILDLIHQLKNLRALIVQCPRSEMNEDILVWLAENSSLTFTSSHHLDEIRLWIR